MQKKVITIKLIRYNNAVMYIKGNPDREQVEEAAIRFFKKAQMQKKKKEK